MFYWNIFVLEPPHHSLKFHTHQMWSRRIDLNQAQQQLKPVSNMTPKCRNTVNVHFRCKKRAQRSTSHPSSTHWTFSPWPLLTETFVFHPALPENKDRQLKAVPCFTPTSTKQFSTMLIPFLGWSEDKSAEIANVYKPKNRPYVWKWTLPTQESGLKPNA